MSGEDAIRQQAMQDDDGRMIAVRNLKESEEC